MVRSVVLKTFMPRLERSTGGGGHLGIGSSVRLFIRKFVPLTYKVQYLKFGGHTVTKLDL